MRQCSKEYSLHKDTLLFLFDISQDFTVSFRIKWFYSTIKDSVNNVSSVDIRTGSATSALVKEEDL